MKYATTYDSPLGTLILTADEIGLTGLRFAPPEWNDREAQKDAGCVEIDILKKTKHWLTIYFSGEIPDFTPPLHLSGTEFRKEVWSILLTIPYGQTVSYGEIAKQLEQKRNQEGNHRRMSAQAVGGAVGHNEIAIIVPCHRVIGADGSLTGYAGGLDKKIFLLELEQEVVSGD